MLVFFVNMVEIKFMKNVVFKFAFRSMVLNRPKTVAKVLGRRVLNQDKGRSNFLCMSAKTGKEPLPCAFLTMIHLLRKTSIVL